LDEAPAALAASLATGTALARALLAASMPDGPTVATAGRLAALLDRVADPARVEAFAARALDPAATERLVEEMRGLDWVREVAARRLSVAAMAPPPGLPDLPVLLRVTPPEAWQAVQVEDGAAGWRAVPQREADTAEAARDPVPTLRLPRPWRAAEFTFRYLDRDGVASAPVAWRFDPVAAMRDAAQRALVRQGPFALYLPGRLTPTRLNPLPIAAPLRPGLTAVEWYTEGDRRIRRAELGLTDAQVLAGNATRAFVEFDVGTTARSLFLRAIFADSTRSDVVELPIR
jgi:hypothetical protein